MSPPSSWDTCPLVKAASKLECTGDGRRAMQPLRLLHRRTRYSAANCTRILPTVLPRSTHFIPPWTPRWRRSDGQLHYHQHRPPDVLRCARDPGRELLLDRILLHVLQPEP